MRYYSTQKPVLCYGCGKMYDVDGNSGVCPECGKVGAE